MSQKYYDEEHLSKIIRRINDLLRNAEGLTRDIAQTQFDMVFSLKLLEPKIRNKQIDFSENCLFSRLANMTNEKKLYDHFNNVTLDELYESVLRITYFLYISDPYILKRLFELVDMIDIEKIDKGMKMRLFSWIEEMED